MTIAIKSTPRSPVAGITAYHQEDGGQPGFTIVSTGAQWVDIDEARRLGRYLLDLPDPTTSDLLGVAIRGIGMVSA